MTINVFPVDAVSGSPAYSGRMLRQALGASWSKGSRPLGARSGLVPGQYDYNQCYTTTSTTYTVLPHVGVIDAEGSTAGPYVYTIDANISGNLGTAAASGKQRYDLVSVQISDPAEGDGSSTPSAAVIYTTGTEAASATVPATPARSLALIQLFFTSSGFDSASPLAPFTVSAGGVLPMLWGTGGSGAAGLSNLYPGRVILDGTLNNNAGGIAFYDANKRKIPTTQGGSKSYSFPAGSTLKTGTVTFANRYSGAPSAVVCTVTGGAAVYVNVTSLSATSFNYAIATYTGSAASADYSGSFYWIAIP